MQEKNEINKSNMDLFGKRLRYIRELNNFNQDVLANKLGQKGYQTVSRYERGERYPNKSTMDMLAKYLNVSLECLLTGYVNENYSCEILLKLQKNCMSVKEIAEKLNVPEALLNAVVEKRISPSSDFFNRVMQVVGIKPQGNLKDKAAQAKYDDEPIFARSKLPVENERVTYLQYRIEKLNNEISEKDAFIDELFSQIEQLKNDNEKLREKLNLKEE